MSSRTDLVVVVAPDTPATRGLRDVLRDWTALRLTRPFLWVDASAVDPWRPLGEVVASEVTRCAATRVRLQDHLADQQDLGLVRLVPVSAFGAASGAVTEQVAMFLYTGLHAIRNGRVSPVHCLVGRHGQGGFDPGRTWPGWHTVVVAPEDAWTPEATATDLTYEHSDGEYHNHVAAAVASLTGLWEEVDEAPFDAVRPDGVSRPVVARAFVRHLDGAAVAAQLRHVLTDLSVGLPRPRHGSTTCQHLRQPEAGVKRTAQAVLDRHSALFAMRSHQPTVRRRQQLGAGAALRMFGRFVLDAVRRTPWTLAHTVRTYTSATVSRGIQRSLFGDDQSRFEIITNGVNAAGLPAQFEALATGTHELVERVNAALPDAEPSMVDTGPFWRDVISGALTLADGGQRTVDIPPVTVSGVPGVVHDTAYVAPDPGAPFRIPPRFAAQLGFDSVPPHDVRSQLQVAEALRADSANDLETARTADRFEAWCRDTGRAFTTAIGRYLADQLEIRTQRAAKLLHELRDIPPVEPDSDSPTRHDQRGVVRALIILVVGLLVTTLGCIWVVRDDSVHWKYPVSTAVALALGLILWFIVDLVRRQRRIFLLVVASTERHDRYAAALRDIRFAVDELHLMTVLYRQYLTWAPVLGLFVREPFGTPRPMQAGARLAGPLPRAMGIGLARPDPSQVAVAAGALGTVVFECGWLGELWEGLLRDAPGRLGVAGLALHGNPDLLLGDEAGHDSPLRRWAGSVLADGVSEVAGDVLWSRARDALLAQGVDALSASLFGDVEVVGQAGHGVSGRLTGNTFLTQLTSTLGGNRPQHFSSSLFDPVAVSQEMHRVGTTVSIGGGATGDRQSGGVRTGIDQFVVIVQFTDPLPVERLRLMGPLGVPVPVPAYDEPEPSFPDLGF
jgi:hypothetical protein